MFVYLLRNWLFIHECSVFLRKPSWLESLEKKEHYNRTSYNFFSDDEMQGLRHNGRNFRGHLTFIWQITESFLSQFQPLDQNEPCPSPLHSPAFSVLTSSILTHKCVQFFQMYCCIAKEYLGVGTSLVALWLRICLPVQGTQVDPWSGKIPHAAEQLSLCATTTEPTL